MRWIKHLTTARLDEDMSALIYDCGLEGYGFYWLLLEVVAASMDETDRCELTYPLPHWSHLLHSHPNKVSKYLGKLQVMGRVTVEKVEGKVRVAIPNLLKYRDEYSKKSGQTPERLRSKDRDREYTSRSTNKKPAEVVFLPQPEVISAREVVDTFKAAEKPKSPEPDNTEELRRVFELCWNRHEKYKESKQVVLQNVISRVSSGKIDLCDMESRHGPWCVYWGKRNWPFDALTFWGWIEAGMPSPPKEQASNPKQQFGAVGILQRMANGELDESSTSSH